MESPRDPTASGSAGPAPSPGLGGETPVPVTPPGVDPWHNGEPSPWDVTAAEARAASARVRGSDGADRGPRAPSAPPDRAAVGAPAGTAQRGREFRNRQWRDIAAPKAAPAVQPAVAAPAAQGAPAVQPATAAPAAQGAPAEQAATAAPVQAPTPPRPQVFAMETPGVLETPIRNLAKAVSGNITPFAIVPDAEAAARAAAAETTVAELMKMMVIMQETISELKKGKGGEAKEEDKPPTMHYKDVEKPVRYDGKEWPSWNETFKNFLGRRDVRWKTLLDELQKKEHVNAPFTTAKLDEINLKLGFSETVRAALAEQLHEYLRNFTSGETLSVVQAAGPRQSWKCGAG